MMGLFNLKKKVLANKTQSEKNNYFGIITFSPSILFVLVLVIVPVVYSVYLSLTDVSLFSTDQQFIGLENYRQLFQDARFWSGTVNGFIFAIGSVGFQLIFGLLVALALNRNFRGRKLGITLAIFPYLIPTIVLALTWKWLLHGIYGVVNLYLLHFNILAEPIHFFSDVSTAMIFLILANSWKFTSFVVLILLARLQSINETYYEMADVAGASKYRKFKDITLPQLRSAILIVVLLRFIWMFNKFDSVWLITRGGPVGATETLPIFIYEITYLNYDLATGSAAAVILFMILAIFAVIYFKAFKPSRELGHRQ